EEHVKGNLDQGMKQPGNIINLVHVLFPEVNPDTIKRLTTFIHEYSKEQLEKKRRLSE
ncbi:uroporphyrinogen decarboxylase, partial [Bacillus cereus group sp. N28]|nr:uroporphyrinogen decarboxylase [Bacillus cereus group sp. N28]